MTRMADYLLVDISNSYTKLAFASATRISAPVRIATSKLSSSVVTGFLRKQRVRKVVVSSVVPRKNPAILKAIGKLESLWLDSRLKLGVGFGYPKPTSTGAARLTNAAAVICAYAFPACVV